MRVCETDRVRIGLFARGCKKGLDKICHPMENGSRASSCLPPDVSKLPFASPE